MARRTRRKIPGGPIPSSQWFEIGKCDDPGCGAHIRCYDVNGNCMSEIVIGLRDIPDFCSQLHDLAYEKAAIKDD